MLDTIGKLRDTLTEVQVAILQNKFGRDWESFQKLIDSKTEEEADENFDALKTALKKVSIPQLFAIHSELSDEQKSILREIL